MQEDRGYPMSGVESGLKEAFHKYHIRPDKVFTNVEMAAYITTLMRNDAGKTNFSGEDEKTLTLFQNQGLMPAVTAAAENPADESAFLALADSFHLQDEQAQLIEDFDVCPWRMLRYIPGHWHSTEYFELFYCYSGSCPVHFENETLTLHAGSLLILAPGIVHATPCYADDAVLFITHIRSSSFEQVFWNQLRQGGLMERFFRQALNHQKHAAYLLFETGVDPDIEGLLSRVYGEYSAPMSYTAQMLNALMSEFFILLLRRYEGTVRLPRTEKFYWRHEYSAILTYIEQHYQEAQLDEIAQKFNYSRRQIGRIVEQTTDESYSRLIIRLRMEKAAVLLRRGVSPANAAVAVGYQNLSSFYRAFSDYHGCTPKQLVQDK